MKFLRAVSGVSWMTFRSLGTGKRIWTAAVLLLAPAAVALAGTAGKGAQAGPVFQSVVFNLSLGFGVYVLALVYGLSMTSGEIEEGTAGYLYLGALPKWLIVLVQIVVTWGVLTALLSVGLLLTALASLPAGGDLPRLGRDVAGCALAGSAGLLVSLSFYASCGLVFRTRDRLTSPSRCPECKSERISSPRFTLA